MFLAEYKHQEVARLIRVLSVVSLLGQNSVMLLLNAL